MCRVFDETIANHLGPNATDQDCPAEDLTPDFDLYDDDHDFAPDHGDLEVTPEMGDNYLNAEISVLRGGTLEEIRPKVPISYVLAKRVEYIKDTFGRARHWKLARQAGRTSCTLCSSVSRSHA